LITIEESISGARSESELIDSFPETVDVWFIGKLCREFEVLVFEDHRIEGSDTSSTGAGRIEYHFSIRDASYRKAKRIHRIAEVVKWLLNRPFRLE